MVEAMRSSPVDRALRRQRGFGYWLRGALTALFTMSIVLVIAGGALFWFLVKSFDEPGPLADDKVIFIRKGMGANAIAEWLEVKGAVASKWVFFANIMIQKADGRLRAGEYRIKARSSMKDILRQLIEGLSIKHKFTVPEGLTSAQIVVRLKADKVLRGELENVPAEGALLPETYLFERGMTRVQLIDKMRTAQKKLLAELWPKRIPGLPFKTLREAIILASIVEKETGVASERPEVAAVFINRLHKSMRLESDPTIIYGLVGGQGPLGRPILKSEIAKKTPYNTYKIDGLPPTPIANPGRAAIEAVLNPAQTKHLFFVADGTGGHAFAETLAQHKKNVAKWRKLQRERKAEKAAAPNDKAKPKP
jgi:UPF0755 protein